MKNLEKEITKENIKEGNVLMFGVDRYATELLTLYNEQMKSYLNLYQSYTDKTLEEFNNFDVSRFYEEYFELQKNIEFTNKILIQNKLGNDLFNYLDQNFVYMYQIDDKTNVMIVEITNNCNVCKSKR